MANRTVIISLTEALRGEKLILNYFTITLVVVVVFGVGVSSSGWTSKREITLFHPFALDGWVVEILLASGQVK